MYKFIPHGVCSHEITYDIVDGVVRNIRFIGGCDGNAKGISVLAEGHTPEELIDLLHDIKCKSKGTSCPAQLAKALEETLEQKKE